MKSSEHKTSFIENVRDIEFFRTFMAGKIWEDYMEETKEKTITQEVTGVIGVKDLILFNDDVNTFEYVIECLMEVCQHTLEQAEQCATIAHLKGKCPIKMGCYEELKPICDELIRRKLTVAIK